MISLIPDQAIKDLQNGLSEKRYNHSVRVMETAFLLADAWENDYPVDREGLAWASLFHDCGKEISKEQRKSLCANGSIRYGRELTEVGKLNHAPIGALLLEDQYDIQDRDILMTVAYHPTGHPDLPAIGWMTYIADFLEPGRTYFACREEYFQEACSNPMLGLKRVTQMRMEAVLQKNKSIHPLTEQFMEYIEQMIV
ncbi:MAG: bis(5'-nucleosyl)-tetraphosphatase (symmetrical) YqeK [Candidatus Omnitrophica bacterium]|nr:bis(5'-nucleosyl)-tetraphosphatase (symmetrical) YqeK [Candidatus Omnitrophota bacterium]